VNTSSGAHVNQENLDSRYSILQLGGNGHPQTTIGWLKQMRMSWREPPQGPALCTLFSLSVPPLLFLPGLLPSLPPAISPAERRRGSPSGL
jgi:hypothetical protein